MRLRTKILLASSAVLLVGGGVFYDQNSKDHYDPSKYRTTITPASSSASEQGEAEAGGLREGTRVELTLPDQFDTPHTIGPEVETLILAFSKGSGGTVRGYLDRQAEGYLAAHKAVFIADISPFPVVLRNTIALPKLRKSSYSTLLLYEEQMSKALKKSGQGDAITIAKLVGNVVQSVAYIKTQDELARVFE